jgi:hypothetical protein
MTGFEVTPGFLLWLIILGLAVQSGGLFVAAYFLALARDNVRTILAILARAQEYRGPAARDLVDLSPLRDRRKRITLDEMVEGIAADAGSPTLADAVEKTVPDPEGWNEATVGTVEVNVEARNIRLLFRRLDAAFALLRENGVSDELLERSLVLLSPLEDFVEVRTGGFDERAEPIPAERMPIGQVCPDCEHDPNRRVFPMLSPTGICPNCRARWIPSYQSGSGLERGITPLEDPEGADLEPPEPPAGFLNLDLAAGPDQTVYVVTDFDGNAAVCPYCKPEDLDEVPKLLETLDFVARVVHCRECDRRYTVSGARGLIEIRDNDGPAAGPPEPGELE